MAGTTWTSFVAGRKAKASEVNSNFDWIEGSITPMLAGVAADNTYDLGTTTASWKDLHIKGKVMWGGISTDYISGVAGETDIVVSGSVSAHFFPSGFAVRPLGKLWFDAGGDTYITEHSPNSLKCVANSQLAWQCDADSFIIDAASRFYLDGGGNTWIQENAAGDKIDFYCNSTQAMQLYANMVYATKDFRVDATNKIYLDGANDTYLYEVIGNVMSFVCGGSVGLEIRSDRIAVQPLCKIYPDGGGDTYIVEGTANAIDVICGGATCTTFKNGGLTIPLLSQNLKLDGTYQLQLGTTSTYLQYTAGTIYMTPNVKIAGNLEMGTYVELAHSLGTLKIDAGTPVKSAIYIYTNASIQLRHNTSGATSYTTLDVTYNNFQFFCDNPGWYLIMNSGTFYPPTDGSQNLGVNSSNDWKNIYYHSLNAHCFDTVKKDISNSIPAQLFETLPKTGKFRSFNSDETAPKKYGFYVDTKDSKPKPYVNENPETHDKSISIHGLIAQLTECVKNLDTRLAKLEK